MTESLEFLTMIAVLAAVSLWYILNAETGSEGFRGLFAIADDPETAKPKGRRKSYRMKQRLARRAHERRDIEDAKAVSSAKAAFRSKDHGDRMRRRFRRQDEARYRVKDRAASYRPKEDHPAA